MEHLTETEKEKLYSFNEDKVLAGAIKKVILEVIYTEGTLRKGVDPNPRKNTAFALANLATSGQGVISDEEIGADLRGMVYGIKLLESGMAKIATIKREKKEKSKEKNKAI